MGIRIAFLHPDLGLGGAERLVVDAAVGLKRRPEGNTVTMYTSHYNAGRSFAETRDGTFPVFVAGDWLPRSLCGGLHILFAILRAVWLAVYVALTAGPVDVFFCDQVAAYVPILRLLRPRARVVFYLHFPDQLLSQRGGWLKSLYRAPFNAFEAWATACAHEIVVNSKFTRGVAVTVFPGLATRQLDVIYPCCTIPRAAEYVNQRAIKCSRNDSYLSKMCARTRGMPRVAFTYIPLLGTTAHSCGPPILIPISLLGVALAHPLQTA